MEKVKIQISPRQMSKLRNGHKVRVKKPKIEGEGFNVIVSPENFSLITKSFTRNKGSEIVLSADEILANKEQAPMMEGEGIFGKKFDKRVEKTLGKRGKKRAYEYAREVLNPLAKGALTAGLTAGATALGAVQPELIPFLAPSVPALTYMAYDYLDNPSAYQSRDNLKKGKSFAKKYAEQQALDRLNQELGTNMGNLSKASLGKALENKASQQLNNASIQAQQTLLNRLDQGLENFTTLSPQDKELLKGTSYEWMIGSGLYSGRGLGAGLYSGSGLGAGLGAGLYASNRRGGAIIGNNGGFVRHRPQALQSQPNSANFQFRYTLPVALQKMVIK